MDFQNSEQFFLTVSVSQIHKFSFYTTYTSTFFDFIIGCFQVVQLLPINS